MTRFPGAPASPQSKFPTLSQASENSLAAVKIPNSVTGIGDGAFSGCTSLAAVKIPNSVTGIGDNAFSGCTSLSHLIIGDGKDTLTISSSTFNDCPIDSIYLGRSVNKKLNFKSLKVLTIGSSITSIGSAEFKECTNLTVVEIPNSVTSIGSSAFSECSSLATIEIPNSVTSIGSSAFEGCTGLTAVEIPNSVTSIGSSAFEGCTGLTAVEIGNSVTTIESSMFYNCKRLRSVTIGTGVLSIESNVFRYQDGKYTRTYRPAKVIWLCNTPPEGYNNAEGAVNYVANTSYGDLWNVKVYPYLSSLFEVGGIKYVPISPSERTCEAIDCAYDTTSIVRIGRTVNYQGVEMTVEDIRPYVCYDNDHIKALHLEGYVGDIGHSAFYSCDSLAGVTIPNTVGDLGESCFESCTALTQAGINVNGNIDDRCFYGCTALTQADINVNGSLGRSCFQGCTALTQADINVNGDLGRSCFQGCKALTQADINVNGDLGRSCFQGCKALTQADINVNGSLGGSCFQDCTTLTQATLGDSITKISWSCFNGCASLAEITIPAAVDSIGNNVFEGCTSLANVTIADRDSVLALGCNEAAYSSYDDEPMFADCPLNAVYIGGNISYPTAASRGYSPFYRNTSLESVTITDKETEISENEFYGCTNLKNVTLGDGIETIGRYAFSGCAALEDFTFGSSLKSIGEEAFSDCTAMTRLVSRTAEPPRCGPQALDDINKWTCKLYVPDASLDAYKAADQWKEFFFITDIAHATEDGGSSADRILSGRVQVFDLSGRQLKEARNANSIDEVLNGLPSGTYILRGSGAAMKVIHE